MQCDTNNMQSVNNSDSQEVKVADVLRIKICVDLAGGNPRASRGADSKGRRDKKGGGHITPRATKPNPPATGPTLQYPRKDISTQIMGRGWVQ